VRLADEVRREGSAFVVLADGTEHPADAVVFASPAFVSADLVEALAPDAARELRQIPYVSTAVALLVYPKGTGSALPDSSGFVVPRGKLAMTACTLISRKWPEEAFGDRAVVRCFVGATGTQDDLDAATMSSSRCSRARSRRAPALGPEDARVVRWPSAMPQHEVGHLTAARRGLDASRCVRGWPGLPRRRDP
jgi:oxygen-dependent protoporphyrinogen oxidase